MHMHPICNMNHAIFFKSINNKKHVLVLHVRSPHPGWQPLKQCPVTLSHSLGTLQCTLQLSKQLFPNSPRRQSLIKKKSNSVLTNYNDVNIELVNRMYIRSYRNVEGIIGTFIVIKRLAYSRRWLLIILKWLFV